MLAKCRNVLHGFSRTLKGRAGECYKNSFLQIQHLILQRLSPLHMSRQHLLFAASTYKTVLGTV